MLRTDLLSIFLFTLSLALLPIHASAVGMPELPPDLPELALPDDVPDLDQLPQLPNLVALFPQLPEHGGSQGERPDLGVPLGPPSPLPPIDLPPGLEAWPPRVGCPRLRGPSRPFPSPWYRRPGSDRACLAGQNRSIPPLCVSGGERRPPLMMTRREHRVKGLGLRVVAVLALGGRFGIQRPCRLQRSLERVPRYPGRSLRTNRYV